MDSIKDIKKYKLFESIDETEIAALLRCFNAKVKTVEKGITFIHKGDRISCVYLIIKGVSVAEVIDSEGNHNTNFEFSDSDIIGINSLINGNKYFPEDVYAKTDVELLILDGFRLLNPCNNFCPRHTKVLKNLVTIISKQNYIYEHRVKTLTKHGTKEKIMSFLEFYMKETGKREFDIPYTQQDLAKYLGVERSALSTELSHLEKDGKIAYRGKHYKILEK